MLFILTDNLSDVNLYTQERVCKVFGKGYLTFRHIVGARSPRPRWNTSYPSAVVGMGMWQGVGIGRGNPAPTCSAKNFTHPQEKLYLFRVMKLIT